MESFKWVDRNGTIEYRNEYTRLHRLEGPALEFTDGYTAWYINGERHREDGPAVIYSDGDSDYWLNDISYSKEQWELEITKIKLNRIKDL